MMKRILLIYILIASYAFEMSAQTGSRILESAVAQAVECYNHRDFTRAQSILDSVLSKDDSNDAAHYYSGLCLAVEGKMDGALEHLRKAVELDAGNFWYRYRLAGLYSVTGSRELAINLYEKLLEDFPKKNDLYYELVDLYLSEGRSDKALSTLEQIETVFGKNESTTMAKYELLNRMQRQQEALDCLTEFNEEYSSARTKTALADYHMSVYDDSLALNLYSEALELSPDYPPALLGKAEVYRLTRRNDEYFNILWRLMPDRNTPAAGKSEYFKAVLQHADPKWVNNFRPQLDSAVSLLTAAHPTDSSVLVTAGIYYYSTSRKNLAKGVLRKNMECWPESIGAAASYAEVLMYSDDWTALSAEGRRCYSKFPNESTFLQMACVADYNLHEYRKVLNLCDTILKVESGDSAKMLSCYSTMGDMYHDLGETRKAYKAYDKALKINPEYVNVLNNYAYYLSMEGKKLSKAYNMSKITVEKEPDNSTYLDTFAWILHLQGKDLEAKPFFKHAMLYGGKDSAVVLDHYAEVLYALGEYDLAFVYWSQAEGKNTDGDVPGLSEKIASRKLSCGK